MDRMYRWTRHVYDVTRRYYLLGRDRLIEKIATRPAGRVLEVGCGTAWNLRLLRERAPQHTLCGLDVSRAMLATARRTLARASCARDVTLRQSGAEELSPTDQFGVEGPFDVIFFSYVLSMIPSWPGALEKALSRLALDGRLYIVDFWDQGRLPNWGHPCCRGGSPCSTSPLAPSSSA
jgi:S-adenosylmethionine-diacylgycerolhomoserine-N-methlytransferase